MSCQMFFSCKSWHKTHYTMLCLQEAKEHIYGILWDIYRTYWYKTVVCASYGIIRDLCSSFYPPPHHFLRSKDPHSLHPLISFYSLCYYCHLHRTTRKILRPKNTGRGRGDMRQVLQLPVQGGGWRGAGATRENRKTRVLTPGKIYQASLL